MGNKASSAAAAAPPAASSGTGVKQSAAATAGAEPWRHLTRESSQRKFTTSQVTALHEKFKLAAQDSPDPRSIPPQSFRQALADVGVHVESDSVAAALFSMFDTSRSGEVDFREFVMGLNLLSRGTLRDKIELAFHIFDADNSGQISKEEMCAVLRLMDATSVKAAEAAAPATSTIRTSDNELRGVSIDEFVDKVFATCQRDQSGTLSFGEFVTSVLKHPALAHLDDLIPPARPGSLAKAAETLAQSPILTTVTKGGSGSADLAVVASMAAHEERATKRRETGHAVVAEAHAGEDDFTRERNEWIREGLSKKFIRYDAKTGKTVFVD